MPKTIPFGERLRSLRQDRGLSVQALADAAGLHRNTVDQYERGLREPTFKAVCALADALGASTEDLRG